MKIFLAVFLLIGLLQATQATDWYVATNGTGLGTNGWANATNNLQGAINNSVVNDTIWVSNGVYDTGGVTNYPAGYILTNRIAIWKSITVRSKDNDPTNTIIRGAWDPATNGTAAVRCVYMTSNSWLIGFTLTNGATMTTAGYDSRGGGVFCPAVTTPAISNCLITGNSAYGQVNSPYPGGGGAYYGTLFNCTLIGNSAYYFGGGANNSIMSNCMVSGNSAAGAGGTSGGTLYNCTITGNWYCGVSGGTLYNCTVISNRAATGAGGVSSATLINSKVINNTGARGGGAVDCTMYNCLLTGNTGNEYGSATLNCILNNCTVTRNLGSYVAVNGGTLNNCIVYYNNGANWTVYGYGGGYFTNTCTTPAQGGWAVGNITNAPLFINTNDNYRLSADSPCINAGTNFSWMTGGSFTNKDLDGRQRLRYGTVDMGAYEHIRAGTIYGVR